jgi:hypothetical protein
LILATRILLICSSLIVSPPSARRGKASDIWYSSSRYLLCGGWNLIPSDYCIPSFVKRQTLHCPCIQLSTPTDRSTTRYCKIYPCLAGLQTQFSEQANPYSEDRSTQIIKQTARIFSACRGNWARVSELYVQNRPSGLLGLKLIRFLLSELKESSFLGGHHHSSHKDSSATITPSDSRSTTPTPGSHGPSQLSSVTSGQTKHVSGASTPVAAPPPTARSGLLKIRLTSGKGLKLPDGGEYLRLRLP